MEDIVMMKMNPNTKIKLDHLGQFYAAVNNENNPGTFSVSVQLKELLIPKTLQHAVSDLMQRLPFLNVSSKRGFLWHYHEVLATPPKIISEKDFPAMCRSFKKSDNHLIRFIYGERSFTIEVLHTVCDGRSLAMVASSLLARYFERLGEGISKEGLIDCNDMMQMEEAEDAYARYADLRKSKFENINEVYFPKYQPSATQIITQKFNLERIKSKAKSDGLTISEYILVHIANEFIKQRKQDNSKGKITINVPVDCRGFFPSKSLRNFVSHKTVIIPDSMEITEIGRDIRKQLTEINSDYIQSKISEMERLMIIGRFVPLFIKNPVIKKVGEDAGGGYTTGFSNLGLIKLPQEIQDKVETFSFALGPEPNMPYQFSCVAVGDTLTLTTTTIAKDTEIIERIANVL